MLFGQAILMMSKVEYPLAVKTVWVGSLNAMSASDNTESSCSSDTEVSSSANTSDYLNIVSMISAVKHGCSKCRLQSTEYSVGFFLCLCLFTQSHPFLSQNFIFIITLAFVAASSNRSFHLCPVKITVVNHCSTSRIYYL